MSHHHHVHAPPPGADGVIRPEVVELTSVGLDIGSTTSHLTLSRLVLQRQGLRLSSRYAVVARHILYRSPVRLTPYRTPGRIDGGRLNAFVARAYRDAGIAPDAVDTGVAIATGEAARKANAPAVARASAAGAGRFVSVAAGPSLEAMLAAYGAGTAERSRKTGQTVLHVDLGGGSCKAALVRAGQIVETAAISVGARLVAFDRSGRVTKIEGPGQEIADSLGIALGRGRQLSEGARQALARGVAELTIAFIGGRPLGALGRRLLLTDPLTSRIPADVLCLSGGVAEYFYGHEARDYGDLGALLADELRRRLPAIGLPVVEPRERIRATVIGLSQYTVQLSGSTIYTSHEDILPLRDLLVVPVSLDEGAATADRVREEIFEALKVHALEGGGLRALALSCAIEPTYAQVRSLVEGIARALREAGWTDDPVVLVFDRDIGGLAGALLVQELRFPGPVVSIDEIDVHEFDHLDIGKKMADGEAVPVVVKSLVFQAPGPREKEVPR